MAGNRKYNYTQEQERQVKNLTVSANILKQDIKKLEAVLELTPEEGKQTVLDKILYKKSRAEEKLAQANEIKQTCLIPVPILSTEEPKKTKKVKKVKEEVNETEILTDEI